MARLNQQYDPAQHEEMQEFTPLAAGDYLGRITKSEMKKTKDGAGQYLELEFTLIAAEHADRKVWTRLNLVNRNATAVKIANQELKSICVAAGINGVVDDSDVLHGKPMLLSLKIVEATAQYGASNSIAKYTSPGSNPAFQQTTIPGMEKESSEAAAASAEKPAWAV